MNQLQKVLSNTGHALVKQGDGAFTNIANAASDYSHDFGAGATSLKNIIGRAVLDNPIMRPALSSTGMPKAIIDKNLKSIYPLEDDREQWELKSTPKMPGYNLLEQDGSTPMRMHASGLPAAPLQFGTTKPVTGTAGNLLEQNTGVNPQRHLFETTKEIFNPKAKPVFLERDAKINPLAASRAKPLNVDNTNAAAERGYNTQIQKAISEGGDPLAIQKPVSIADQADAMKHYGLRPVDIGTNTGLNVDGVETRVNPASLYQHTLGPRMAGSMVPLLGTAMSGGDAVQDFRNGDNVSGALNTVGAVAALSPASVFTGAGKGAIQGGTKLNLFRNALRASAPASREIPGLTQLGRVGSEIIPGITGALGEGVTGALAKGVSKVPGVGQAAAKGIQAAGANATKWIPRAQAGNNVLQLAGYVGNRSSPEVMNKNLGFGITPNTINAKINDVLSNKYMNYAFLGTRSPHMALLPGSPSGSQEDAMQNKSVFSGQVQPNASDNAVDPRIKMLQESRAQNRIAHNDKLLLAGLIGILGVGGGYLAYRNWKDKKNQQ